MTLKDPRPYVFWAHIQWLDESGAIPHLVLQNGPKTLFPPALQSHSTVTFNVSAESVHKLELDENGISFSARFSGKDFRVYAPLDCMLMILSKDQQVRIGLQQPTQVPFISQPIQEVVATTVPVRQKPTLTVIAGDGNNSSKSQANLTLVPKILQPDDDEPECA